MKKVRETDKERADRLERQMDRLKFKQKKQLEKLDAEITRLTNHLNRGRELLHRVTSEIGTKQNERDLALARADALNKLLIAVMGNVGDLQIPIEQVKKAGEDHTFVDIKVDGDLYIIALGTKEEAETDGETEQAMVSASDKENEPSGNSESNRVDQTESIPPDSGAQD